jgi:ABC-type lipoprotein export system ATPase subunit
MKKIQIKNLGPVKFFEMEIKKFNILIGPQASGKSTIAKAIYIVNIVQKELVKFVKNISNEDEKRHLLRNFNKSLKALFVNIFGNTKYMQNFEIIYEINKQKKIKFYLKNGWVMVFFSDKLKSEIESIKSEITSMMDIEKELHLNPLSEELLSKKAYIYGLIDKKINSIFENDLSFDYIPAGRSLLTILAEQLGSINISSIDYITKTFMEKIIFLKKLFYQDIDSVIESHKKFSSQKIDFQRVNIAKDIIYKILKGNYIVANGLEFLHLKNGNDIKINFASSGQQESLWILNLIFYSILYNLKLFTVVEEPEAHLYPIAQKEIVELISLFGNKQNNQILITTHSPYILSSFNNLIYAKNLAKNKEISFIRKEIMIDYNDVNAFMINEENFYSILDDEIKQIKTEEIDKASEILNKEYEKLLEMEFNYE